MKKDMRNYMKDLSERIIMLNHHYYNLNESKVSDSDYDSLYNELLNLEEKYPEYKVDNSPTDSVGSVIDVDLERIKHEEKMLSLGNSMNEEELISFYEKLKNQLNLDDLEIIGEMKIDGLAVSLRYENGKFVKGATRGDGVYGEDITNQLRMLDDVPLEVDYEGNFEVRGEVFMKKSVLNELNDIRESEGKKLFANCRNAASGSIKLKDLAEVKKRKLSVYFYSLHGVNEVNNQREAILFLDELGFSVNDNFKCGKGKSFLINVVENFTLERDDLDYDIDGIVFKVNSFELQNLLGFNSREPRWATAFKFKPGEVITRLREIVLSMGRTGVMTPNAVLEGVHLDGTTIRAASLHNMNYIKEKDIREGDYVVIRKAGDIIPEVVRVLKEYRDETIVEYVFPDNCNFCGSKLVKNENEVAIKCENSNCCERNKYKIIYFTSKSCMDIGGLGEGVIKSLFDNGLLSNIEDIYNLVDSKEDLLKLERFGERSVNNLISSIEKSKSNKPSNLLCGLGIPLVGRRASEGLLEHFKDLRNLISASKEELMSVDVCGDKMSDNIIKFFSDYSNVGLIHRLEKKGLNMVMDKEEITENKYFEGKLFVVTGKFVESGLKRGDVEKIIKEFGGKTGSSVTKKTDVVIVGESAGSKLKRALELGTEIWEEVDFLDKI